MNLPEMPLIPRFAPAAPVTALLAAMAFVPSLVAQVTEVPQTIEPGHVLMRMDAISFGAVQDTSEPNQYRALALGTTLVSAGITDSLDFEFGAELFLRDTFETDGSEHTDSGIGDIILQPKWTFWKDPSSGQEAAIVPYIMIPTNSSAVGNNSLEGGVILPWSMDVAAGFKVGAMLEWDELRNEANTRYDTRWYGSAVAKWSLGDRFGAYAETTLSASTAGTAADVGSIGGGATLNVSGNFQWDFEVSREIGRGRNPWTEVLRFRWKIL
jgi:hypothetical protein